MKASVMILALALGCLVVTEAAGAPNARRAIYCRYQGRCRMQHATVQTTNCIRMINARGRGTSLEESRSSITFAEEGAGQPPSNSQAFKQIFFWIALSGCYQACARHTTGRMQDADRFRYISKTVHVEGWHIGIRKDTDL